MRIASLFALLTVTAALSAVVRFEVCQNKHCRKKGESRYHAGPPVDSLTLRAAFALARVALEPRPLSPCTGAATTLHHFQELSEGLTDVEVVVADMGHTEHGCFDECTMGPNVRLDGEPRTDGGKVLNGVKGPAAVAALLGVDVPDGYK